MSEMTNRRERGDVGDKLRDRWREVQVARHTVHNLADVARQSGVEDQLLAEAMILQGWMLITGSTEAEAREAIRSILAAKLRIFH